VTKWQKVDEANEVLRSERKKSSLLTLEEEEPAVLSYIRVNKGIVGWR